MELNTWSIVAADPESGDVGVAAASCVPNVHIDAVAALVPGKGAAATQAYWDQENRDKVYELLLAGNLATDIIREVTDPGFDADHGIRQYGVVTIGDGSTTVAAFTGAENLPWSGDKQGINMAVTVQGNILVNEAVVAGALDAFQSTDDEGHNTLPDRMMRALEAGSAAGGDSRCNDDQIVQTAASAFILVARGSDNPYAAEEMGVTVSGAAEGPWLALSVAGTQFGPNPLIELRERYDLWRQENIPEGDLAPDSPKLAVIVVLAAFVLVAALLAIARSVFLRPENK